MTEEITYLTGGFSLHKFCADGTLLNIQCFRMKGIQNKIIISQKAFIIRIYGLRHSKGKLSEMFLSV
jgi:hypothetical protein